MGKQQQVIFINTGWHGPYDGTNGHEFSLALSGRGRKKVTLVTSKILKSMKECIMAMLHPRKRQ